jgi:hypothetical protein
LAYKPVRTTRLFRNSPDFERGTVPDGQRHDPWSGLAHRSFQQSAPAKGDHFARGHFAGGCSPLADAGGWRMLQGTGFGNVAAGQEARPECAMRRPEAQIGIPVYQSTNDERQPKPKTERPAITASFVY